MTREKDAQTAFVSYSREDSEFALRLVRDLKAAGARVWLDQLDITPGQLWDRAVEDALKNCSRLVVVLSLASVNSTDVMDEVSFALDESKTVIPVIYQDCTLPYRLRRLYHVDFRENYKHGLQGLIRTFIPGQSTVQGNSLMLGARGGAMSGIPTDDRQRAERERRQGEDTGLRHQLRKIPTSLPGVFILEPRVFGDERGFFFESYNQQLMAEAGIVERFVQDNHSCSTRNVLRGLHYQVKHPQGKLVRVVDGEILDVAVDMRESSPTFGRWEAVRLSGENKRMLLIPAGFAHGFRVFSEKAHVLYKTTDFYAPEHERTLAWNDSDIEIDWELDGEPIVSAKDQRGVAFRDADVFEQIPTVTIFGASGLLGKALTREWSGEAVNGFSSQDVDIRDAGRVHEVVRQTRPQTIILAAAYTDVDGCESNPDLAFEVNRDGAINVATAAKMLGARLVFLSSDYVFDGGKMTPYETGDARNPQSVYGRTKAEAEIKLLDLMPECCIVRTSWLFGMDGKCFPDTVLRLAAKRPTLEVVNDQRGCPTYALDLARAIVRLCRKNASGIVHVTNAGDCTWFEFAKEIVQGAGLTTTVRPTSSQQVARPAPRPAYSALSPTRLNAFGIEMPSWHDALQRYLEQRQLTS